MTTPPDSPGNETSQTPKSPARPAESTATGRLMSLDVCRGLVMISLASSGFGLRRAAQLHLDQQPESSAWQTVLYQASHTEWIGCSVWDMVQPLFMFMVGVAMAYSYGKRRSLGQTYGGMFGHAVGRSLILVLLGFALLSIKRGEIYWSLMNVLTQIGLGYTFVFLLWGRRFSTQAVAAVCILVSTWFLYQGYAWTGRVGADTPPHAGAAAEEAAQKASIGPAWQKDANLGYAVDQRLLGRLPKGEKWGWKFNVQLGTYVTLNFFPSIATMLFGLMCGELLRLGCSPGRKLATLLIAGISGIAAGLLLHTTGLCPIVKKLWTPAFALFSSGICCLVLGALFLVVDVWRQRWWAWPLAVVGMNSLAVYCTAQLGLGRGFNHVFRVFFTAAPYEWLGPANQPILWGLVSATGFVLICWWMYRQRIFVRV